MGLKIYYPRKAGNPWTVEDEESGTIWEPKNILILKDSEAILEEGKLPYLWVTGAEIEISAERMMLIDPRPPWRRSYPPS
jgi:hypothetical protein